MSATLMEREIGPEEQDAIRAEIREIIESSSKSQAEVAREIGLPYGTFTGWYGGTYKGRTSDKAAAALRWLEARKNRAERIATLPDAPRFCLTPTAEKIFSMLGYAQMAPDLVVLSGGAGIGKTTAIEEYQRLNPNVWIITGDPSLASPHNILVEIGDALGVIAKSTTRFSKAIKQRLRGTGGLLIVDEAQHLTTQALDQLRSLHDASGVGLAISGNETVYSRLEGEGRKAQFAQIFSRVGMRITKSKPEARDICTLIEAWNIADQSAVGLLKTIARKPGALRGLTKTLRLAHMIAAGSGEDLSEKHVRQAWLQLSSQTIEQAS